MYTQQNTSLSVISSDPIQIRFCEFCEQVINRNEYFQCFFQPINLTFDDIMPQAHLYFINNSANISGDALYGGNLDSCFSLFYYYSFKSLFSWINLDLGIETCFINGMGSCSKTWLQFIFPGYVWFLLILIIIISRYSSKVVRLMGRQVIPALATMILLSYTKLIRIVFLVLHYINVP